MEPEETRPIDPPGPSAPPTVAPLEVAPLEVAPLEVAPPEVAPAEATYAAAEPAPEPEPFFNVSESAFEAEGQAAPPLPEVTPVLSPAAFPTHQQEASSVAVQPEPEAHPAGPNWMLAFVCAWAGITALNEAWAVLVPIGIKAQLLRNTAFLGYALLGFGLVLFAVEALRWGARRREGGGLMGVVLPALMTLAGVVALVMSQDPGRRI